jgi:hypothetical protein
MTKLIATLAVVATAAMAVPQPLAAADCTREYMQCLNDSWDLDGVYRYLADIECYSKYVGCVAKNVVMD